MSEYHVEIDGKVWRCVGLRVPAEGEFCLMNGRVRKDVLARNTIRPIMEIVEPEHVALLRRVSAYFVGTEFDPLNAVVEYLERWDADNE